MVVSFETIEHLTDHRRMMLEIKRVLAPGGVLVLSSPDRREYRTFHVTRTRTACGNCTYRSCMRCWRNISVVTRCMAGEFHYASVLAPADGKATPFVGYRDDENGGAVEGAGLPNPVYLIGVASDGPLPELPVGLFIPKQPPYMRDIAFLSEELEAQQRLVASMQSEINRRDGEAEGLRRQIAALDQRGQRVDELAAQLRESIAETKGAQQQLAALRRHSEEIERQRTEAVQLGEALRASRSWRATAPLRGIGLGLRKMKRGGYLGAALASRFAYRILPLPMGFKQRLKHHFFDRAGSIFATTGAYARWQEMLRQQAATAAKAPGPAIAPPPFWTAEVLPIADGHWEWQGYARMRARIAEILAARRAAHPFRPRPMIQLGDEDPAQAAARITLKPPGDAPEVSVIVPVFNELASTIECLLSLSATAGDVRVEVIVANDASTDRTQEVLSRIPNLATGQPAGKFGLPAQLQHCSEKGARPPLSATEQ